MKGKKILLISDTHGFHDNLKEVVQLEAPFDRVLHMGDTEGWDPVIEEIVGVPMELVSGNCDWASALPSEKTVMIGGVRIFMTHGHEYYVTTGMDVLRDQALACGCQIALFGHTHRPVNDRVEGIYVVNPGSAGMGSSPTWALIELEPGAVRSVSIRKMRDMG